jgi:hypothetical protein
MGARTAIANTMATKPMDAATLPSSSGTVQKFLGLGKIGGAIDGHDRGIRRELHGVIIIVKCIVG